MPQAQTTTQYFDLHVRVERSKVATIIEVLKDEGKLISCTEYEEPTNSVRVVRKHVTPQRNAVIGYDFGITVLERLGVGAKFTSQHFADAFEADGRKPNSASPILSKLHQKGYIRKLEGHGAYQVVGVGRDR